MIGMCVDISGFCFMNAETDITSITDNNSTSGLTMVKVCHQVAFIRTKYGKTWKKPDFNEDINYNSK